jgi:hypothetical protein
MSPARRVIVRACLACLALESAAGAWSPAAAQPGFPKIAVWTFPGAWQDSTVLFPNRCPGQFKAPLPDSIREQARTITVRWHRDRLAELRPDFGGYRIYRVTNRLDPNGNPDTTSMVLLRRYSINAGDEVTWHFSRVFPPTLEYMCNLRIMGDSVVTFVDPDSTGAYYKVCRKTEPPNDPRGRCLTPGDSVYKLIAPPGPHDGFRTWYAVTYEAKNVVDNNFEDLFVPDLTGIIGPCFGPAPDSCFNLNNKLANVAVPVASTQLEPTPGPAPDLERVAVVPNPYRASEAWDSVTGHEVHFINLPARAKIKIYTVAGDLVVELEHDDRVRDFERWNLKNDSGQDVASGIYMYRVESDRLSFQNRFVVIR